LRILILNFITREKPRSGLNISAYGNAIGRTIKRDKAPKVRNKI